MAVYRWIYANAKMEGDRRDYHIRVCDRELEGYRGILIELSNRLLSVDRRRGEAQQQKCWFSGYLDEKMYLVAVGGDQRELLGIEPERYRPQYCVLGYGFTQEDIRLYEKKDELFEPLKKILRDIQEKGRDDVPSKDDHVSGRELLKYTQTPGGRTGETDYNLVKSTASMDGSLWQHSLAHPVMTGIISAEDGKKLLKYFPNGVATVLEEVRLRYEAENKKQSGVLSCENPVIVKQTKGSGQNSEPAGRSGQNSEPAGRSKKNSEPAGRSGQNSEPAGRSGQNSELEKLRSEQEEVEKRLEDIREERSRKEGQARNAAVLFVLLIFFAVFFWFL